MLLDAINKSLEIMLGGAITANQLPFVAWYADLTTTTFAPAANDGVTNGVTAVTLVAAPGGAGIQRQVKMFSVYNADTAAATVIIQLNNNSTKRIIIKVTLNPGETLIYQMETGFAVRDIFGIEKVGGTFARLPVLLQNPVKDATNLTTVTVFATTVCQVHFMGVCPQVSNSINLLVNITTGVATITWAEIAVYKGTPMLNGACPDLTRLGWQDVAAVYNTTGYKNTAIALATPAQPGDSLWIVLGCQATTPFQMRGGLADNLQSGLFNTLTARPSLTPGPITGVLAGAAAVPAWIAIKIN